MPITCTSATHDNTSDEFMSTLGKEKIPDFLHRIMLPVNSELLLKVCHRSINTLSVKFNIPQNSSIMLQLRGLLTSEHCSYTTHLALLFLLLNVDQELKEDIMQSEHVHLHAKLTRFFLDLRNEAVRVFFCKESMQSAQFVTLVQELWQIA